MLLFLTLSALLTSVACVDEDRERIPRALVSRTSNLASGRSVVIPTLLVLSTQKASPR